MTETAILNALNNVDVKVKLSDDSEVNGIGYVYGVVAPQCVFGFRTGAGVVF